MTRPTPQQLALLAVTEELRQVRSQGSQVRHLNWAGSICTRCRHTCHDNHHPGSFGRCNQDHCTCLMAVVACQCGHPSYDHEPWGQETGNACQRCPCPVIRPALPITQPDKEA